MGLETAPRSRRKRQARPPAERPRPLITSTSTRPIPASGCRAGSASSRRPVSGRPAARRASSSTPRSTARTRRKRPTRRQGRAQGRDVGPPERAPGHRAGGSRPWASWPSSARSTRSWPCAATSTGSSLPRLLPPLRPRREDQFVPGFRAGPGQSRRKLGPRSLRNVPHPHRRHPFRRPGRDQALNLEETAFRTEEWLQALATSASRHGHLREPQPRGRRGHAEEALRGPGGA